MITLNYMFLSIKRTNGSIFFLSLWSLVFLSLLALSSGSIVKQQLIVMDKIEERKKLYSIAESGIFYAMDIMKSSEMKDATPNTESLNDFWLDSKDLFKGKRISDGSFTITYRKFNEITKKEERRYGMIDEERKINLNYAGEDILIRLLHETASLDMEQSIDLARSIIDWRDSDDAVYGEKHKISEKSLYKKDGYAYAPRNRYFQTLEEVFLVRNMSLDVFLKIRDYVTVFTGGRVNINTAHKEVLSALGIDQGLIDKITIFRAGANTREGDLDDRIFSTTSSIIQELSMYYDLSKDEKATLEKLISEGILDVRSSVFTLKCFSQLDNSNIYGTIICVFEKGGKKLYWGVKYHSQVNI